jgi:dTDP-4-amino-4,6-dideoxygalactose transaminase
LEERFAALVGVRYAMAVASGTAALHAACYAAGISRGEEVISTPLAFSGFANAPLYLSARLVFADVGEYDLNISPVEIERNLTEGTCAIVASHFAGHPCDLESIGAIARRHGLAVVEDATSALGASYRGKTVGSFATAAAFSFHPEATITAGAGGMVTTDDEDTYRWLKLFCNQGIVRDRAKLVNAKEGPWHYEVQELGYDYRPTEIQAALALSQLEKLPSFLKRRREIAARYNDAFCQSPLMEIPYEDPDKEDAWNLYVLKLNPESLRADRMHIFLALQAEGVEVGVHYLPVYLHPLHGWLGDPNVCTLGQDPPCPRAETIYRRLITLPLYPRMSDADILDVITAVNKVLTFYSR